MRLATLKDFPVFDAMLRLALAEQEATPGTSTLFTRRTLERYRELARDYMSGRSFGSVALGEIETEQGSEIVGFSLCGEDRGPTEVDLRLGKIAIGWLIWTRPEHRHSGMGLAMLLCNVAQCREMGFDTMLCSIREGNVAMDAIAKTISAVPTEHTFAYRLTQESGHAVE